MQLSPHFALEEFTRSDKARAMGVGNDPTPAHLANLVVCAEGLEQVRALIGSAIRIHSGYRNPVVNKAVGGVPTSAHALGFAADITSESVAPFSLCKLIAESGIAFDQVIYEKSRGICHVSFDPRARGEVKTQAGAAGTAVVWGLHS